MKQTKIVASVSDRRCSVEFIRSLYEAGVNVIRMNTAHATPDGLREIIRNTRAVSADLGILIDTKGPEVRSTKVDAPIDYVTGEHLTIEQPFVCDYGYNIRVGEGFFANYNLVILDPAPVTFGDNVFIAPNCSFTTASHPLDAERRNKGLETCKPIHVGNNVWIGANVVVLPGVTIGDNAVIGAGSVVTRDIPAGYVAYGNPCKPHRKIEDQ